MIAIFLSIVLILRKLPLNESTMIMPNYMNFKYKLWRNKFVTYAIRGHINTSRYIFEINYVKIDRY